MSWASYLSGKGPPKSDPIPVNIRRLDIGARSSSGVSKQKQKKQPVELPEKEAREKRKYEFEAKTSLPASFFTASPTAVPEDVDLPWRGPSPWILWRLETSTQTSTPVLFPPLEAFPAGIWDVQMPLATLQLWNRNRQRALLKEDESRNAEELFLKPVEAYEPHDSSLDRLLLYFWYWIHSSQRGDERKDGWWMDASYHSGRQIWTHIAGPMGASIGHLLKVCADEDTLTQNIKHFEHLSTQVGVVLPPLEGAGVLPLVRDQWGGIDPTTQRDRFLTAVRNLEMSIIGQKAFAAPQHQEWIGRMGCTVAWHTLLEGVTEEKDLDCFFRHIRLMSLPQATVYLNSWDDNVMSDFAHVQGDETWVGNSSGCLQWKGPTPTPAPFSPYTWIWENKEHHGTWFTCQHLLEAATRQGFTCVQNWNLYDLVEEYPATVMVTQPVHLEKKIKKWVRGEPKETTLHRTLDVTTTEWKGAWSRNEWMLLRMMRVLQFNVQL